MFCSRALEVFRFSVGSGWVLLDRPDDVSDHFAKDTKNSKLTRLEGCKLPSRSHLRSRFQMLYETRKIVCAECPRRSFRVTLFHGMVE